MDIAKFQEVVKQLESIKMPKELRVTSKYLEKIKNSPKVRHSHSLYAGYYGIPVVLDETVNDWEIRYE